MEQLYRFALYFLLGGCTTLAASYMNESGKGGMAAMVASLPIFFLLTAMVAYYTAGPSVAFDYARGMIVSNVPWLAAVVVFGSVVYHGYHPVFAILGTIATYVIIMAAVADML